MRRALLVACVALGGCTTGPVIRDVKPLPGGAVDVERCDVRTWLGAPELVSCVTERVEPGGELPPWEDK